MRRGMRQRTVFVEEEDQDDSKSVIGSEVNPDDHTQSHALENYNLKFLTSKKKSSLKFLEECTYYVPLQQLYTVKDTCYYHQGMEFCPVLVQISDHMQKYFDYARYLLQVWTLGGEKVFEQQLNNQVTMWSICHQYFIYKPEGDDDKSDFFHIVDLKNQNATILIKDFSANLPDAAEQPYRYMAYSHDVFYLGNSSHIKVISLKHGLNPSETRQITDLHICTIQIEQDGCNRIHGIYLDKEGTQGAHKYVLVAIETADNQIDYNCLEITHSTSIQEGEDIQYILKQYREVVPRRKQVIDPIVKFETTMNRFEEIYSVAQRQSGAFDLYFNGARVSENPAERLVEDVQLTFDTIYLQMKSPVEDPAHEKKHKPEVRAISMAAQSRINFDKSESVQDPSMETNFFMKIKNHCKIFKSFQLIKSYVVVAHSNYISIFNVVEEQWFDHMRFETDISQIFRQVTDDGEHQLISLLANGKLAIIHANKEEDWNCEELPDHISGKVEDVSEDKENSMWTMILTSQGEDKPELYVIHDSKVHTITHLFPKLQTYHSFSFLFTPTETTQFVYQEKANLTLFEMSLVEGQIKVTQQEQPYAFKGQRYLGKIHSGLIRQKKEGKWMMVFDSRNFYVINMITKDVQIIRNQNCIGMYFIDNNYLYGLCHKSQTRPSGFKLYDVMNVIETGKDYSYPLSNVHVGCQGHIDYSKYNERLVFLSSYESIELVPILHRNTQSFIGMKKRNSYLTQRQFYDRFTTLEGKHTTLTTWNILTGKMRTDLITDLKTQGYDYSEFEQYRWSEQDHVYRASWFTKTLLKKKAPEVDFNDNFYGMSDQPLLKNQVSFIHRMNKEFFEFKLVEITSETSIKEHITFIHPFYKGQEQFLYISSNCEFMVEKLGSDRVFLYKSTPLEGQGNSVRWELVHRFIDFPSDLMEKTQHPFIFTQDFTQYLDLDRKNNLFVVKDTVTQEVKGQIPSHIMNPKSEPPKYIADRFEWISNNQFRLVNKEGNERIMSISCDFKEITEGEFNYIPLYDKKLCSKHHILLDQPHHKPKDNDKRLVRKYQIYKSQQNLFNQTERDQLYRALFTVDYGVNDYKHSFIADLSFTFFHWNLIELMERGKLSTDQIDVEHIQDLCYNILPGGETIVHKFSSRGDLLETLYDICHPLKDDKRTILYHVPFLRNLEGQSPFNQLQDKQDFRSMNMILEYLSLYEVDHHSRSIIDAIPSCVEHDLPNLHDYLDSRILQTSTCKKVTKGELTDEEPVVAASFWMDPTDTQKLFKKAPIEQDIKLQFIDIPKIHTFNEAVSDELFMQLAQTEDMGIFERKAIKKLITFKWPLVLEFTVKRLFLPYLAFLITYFMYMAYIFDARDDTKTLHVLNFVFEGALLLGAAYFLALETRQYVNQGLEYFTSFWNYLDILPPLLVVLLIAFEIIGIFDLKAIEQDIETITDPEIDEENQAKLHTARTIQAVLAATCSLLLWLKMLYFLRIFQKTGYLIRIVIEVVVDMRHFLFILILSIVAFGDALLQISKANPLKREGDETDPQFVEGGFVTAIIYTYRLVLGDWDTSNFGQIASWYAMVLFLICTLFNLVIMLNLLIAIISESFAKINEVSEQASYQEKASMIYENSYLIPQARKDSFCPPNKYLLMATDIDQEVEEQSDDIDFKLKTIKKKLYNRINNAEENLQQKISEQGKALLAEIQKLAKPVQN